MTNLATLASKHSGRPLLMLPEAAQELANRLYFSMPSAFERGSRFDAALRAVGLGGRRARPKAFEDGEAEAMAAEELVSPEAYAPLWMGEPDDVLDWGMSLKDGIATLNLDTAISANGTAFCGQWWHGYDSLDAAFRTAFADDRVKGIFLRIDSPGGVVCGGIDDLTRTIREGREASGGKPVFAYADCAASAAYWIAAQCDRIYAPRAGLVGSIGAVIVHMENAVMLAKHGVKVKPIQFGAMKTAGASFQPLSEGAEADLQAFVDQAGRDFVAAVAEGRPVLTEEALLATEARVYPAAHQDPARSGLALSFIDEIASEADAFAALVDHVTPASSAAVPTGEPVTTEAKTGAGLMATNKKTPARLKAERKAAQARLAAIAAEEELQELEEQEELEAEGEEEDLEAEGEEDQATAEGEEDDMSAEGEEEDLEAEGEEEDLEAEGEEDQPKAKGKAARARAIMALPEAKGQETFARSLVSAGLSVSAAQKSLRAAKRSNAINARSDRPISTRPAAGKANASQQLVGDLVAAAGKGRLRQKD